MKGWICLHRKLLDSDFWNDGEQHNRKSAWIDLLLLANHKDNTLIFDGHKLVVERGQIVTSVRKLSVRWGWSVNRTLRYLRLLEELGMIHRDSDAKRTLLTIVNYGLYQGIQNTNEHSDEHSDEHTNEDSGEYSDESQTTMINNELNNNNKKTKGRFLPPSVDEVRVYCQERNNKVDPEAFVDFYESKGWKVGNNPMKDWKACVRTWERRDKASPVKTNKFINFEGRQYDMTELEKALNR